jgi:putative aminopeptidase FrvX
MRCPAAPYHEALVAEEIRKICSEERLNWKEDSYGNLLITVGTKAKGRPVVFAAHMDHPAFVVKRRAGENFWVADFLGGVGDAYFQTGTDLILMPGNIPAKLEKRISEKTRRFHIRDFGEGIRSGIKPEFAVWSLEGFDIRDGQIHGRACDDLIGVAAAITALVRLKRGKAEVHAVVAITRAEEVGFHGALALAQSRSLARNSLVISLETSRELPGVKMGQGVIMRVGDRASIFNSKATRFVVEVAAELGKAKLFKSQRALMSGGTCEGTAYQEYGFQTAACCVALGNYHNCAENNLIREEFVSVDDAQSMVDLLCAVAGEMKNFDSFASKLNQRLEQLSREALQKLRKQPLNTGNGARRNKR